jgi:hypothetical protein
MFERSYLNEYSHMWPVSVIPAMLKAGIGKNVVAHKVHETLSQQKKLDNVV